MFKKISVFDPQLNLSSNAAIFQHLFFFANVGTREGSMLLNIVYAIFFWIYVLLSYSVFIPERIFALLHQEGLRRRWMHLVGQMYSLVLLTVGWSRILVHHRERFPKRGLPICIVSNHQPTPTSSFFLGACRWPQATSPKTAFEKYR